MSFSDSCNTPSRSKQRVGSGLWPDLCEAHDALIAADEGGDFPFPIGSIEGAVYIARDPRDVAVSFAHHFGTSVDEAICWMGDGETTLDRTPTSPPRQLPQLLSSWSGHVNSWLDAPGLRIHLMRYEDMHAMPHATFAAVARFLSISTGADELTRALDAASFNALRGQERQFGFREREAADSQFFRRGAAGAWREVLRSEQAQRIVRDHGAVMRRLGYLP